MPAVKKHLYSAEADPKADIAAALQQASLEHKRVILSFGGDWCGDCQVLDIYLHQSPNVDIFEKNFVLVHVDIGHYDKNLDIPEKYNVPLKKGVPALAVLDSDGSLASLIPGVTGAYYTATDSTSHGVFVTSMTGDTLTKLTPEG